MKKMVKTKSKGCATDDGIKTDRLKNVLFLVLIIKKILIDYSVLVKKMLDLYLKY